MSGELQISVLRALAIRGGADDAAVARATGSRREAIDGIAGRRRGGARGAHGGGRVAGWGLTPAGRVAAATALAQERAASDLDVLARADRDFGPLNARFKALCHRWQTDAPRDRAAAEEALATIHAELGGVLADAATGAPRLATYGPRLADALDRFRAGDDAALLRPLAESYHDVWMELHHDLLELLGRTRDERDGH